MNAFFRKLFGKPTPEPVAASNDIRITRPEVSAPRAASAPLGRALTIAVLLPTLRAATGWMTVCDASGNVLGGPWPVLGHADNDLATANGNPRQDPLFRFGDTPTGSYRVVDILPARVDSQGIALFGLNAVLRLRPVSGQAGAADANGRTALLIHGGADLRTGTDGSLRLRDDHMADLLALMPPDPSTLRPPVSVSIRERHAAEVLDFAPAAIQRTTYSSNPRRSAGSTTTMTTYDDGFWYGYYQQMYLYDNLMQLPFDERCQGGDPYPYVDCAPQQPTDDYSARDQAAVGVLSGLGYGDGNPARSTDSVTLNPFSGDGSFPVPTYDTEIGQSAPVNTSANAFSGGGGDTWSESGGAYGR